MKRKLVWNADETTKYDPADILRFDISLPGKASFIGGNRATLTQFQIIATPKRTGLIYCGLYNSKEVAVEEVNRLSALSWANPICEAVDAALEDMEDDQE